MAKGWISWGSNALNFGDTRTKEEKRRDRVKEARAFEKAIRLTKRLTEEQYIKEMDKRYEIWEAENAQLMQAYADKKLKSKALIKHAAGLKRKAEAASKKKAKAELLVT